MKKTVITAITIYQKTLSLDTGFFPRLLGLSKPVCIYYPTCSEYTKQAVGAYGVRKGLGMGMKRIARCNPLHEPGVDLLK